MLRIKVLILSIVTAFSIASVQAGEVIYKWKDSKGNIKYTQSKPPSGIDYTTIRNRSSKTTTAPQAKTETPQLTLANKIRLSLRKMLKKIEWMRLTQNVLLKTAPFLRTI